MLGMIFKAGGKILATFFVAIAIFLLDMIFTDAWFLLQVQGWAKYIEGYVADPGALSGGTEKFVWNELFSHSAIMGILITLIARAVVEIGAWAGGALWAGFRAESEVDEAEAAAGITDQGYYET